MSTQPGQEKEQGDRAGDRPDRKSSSEKGSIMRLGKGVLLSDVSVIPTGSPAIDGARSGRSAEGQGRRDPRAGAPGKTTLTLHIIAEVQKQGGQHGRVYRRRTRT